MSSFIPTFDAPDWFGGATGGILVTNTGTAAPGDSVVLGTSAGTSIILFAETTAVNEAVNIQVGFCSDLAGTDVIVSGFLSADASQFAPALSYMDLPAYGTSVKVTNLSTTATIFVSAAAANRVVLNPRYLPSPSIAGGSESLAPFVAMTEQQLVSETGLIPGVAAGGLMALAIQSSGSGVLSFRFTTPGNVQLDLPMVTVTGAPWQLETVTLPQCVGQFMFTPDADDGAGAIELLFYPVNP